MKLVCNQSALKTEASVVVVIVVKLEGGNNTSVSHKFEYVARQHNGFDCAFY